MFAVFSLVFEQKGQHKQPDANKNQTGGGGIGMQGLTIENYAPAGHHFDCIVQYCAKMVRRRPPFPPVTKNPKSCINVPQP
jgi:hypothetical protein